MNCALWSAEVFEDDDGSLKNVHMAVIRGKQLVGTSGDRSVKTPAVSRLHGEGSAQEKRLRY